MIKSKSRGKRCRRGTASAAELEAVLGDPGTIEKADRVCEAAHEELTAVSSAVLSRLEA